jgi:hypothetical protein
MDNCQVERRMHRRDDELIAAWMSLGAAHLMIRRLSEQQRRRRAEGGPKGRSSSRAPILSRNHFVATSKYSPRRRPVITTFQLHSCARTLPQRPLTYVLPTRDPVVRHVSLPSSSSLLRPLVQLTYRDAKSLRVPGLGTGHLTRRTSSCTCRRKLNPRKRLHQIQVVRSYCIFVSCKKM